MTDDTGVSGGGAEQRVVDFDPLDPEFVDDPHRQLRRMRSECPVARSDRWGGFWALTRRQDIIDVASNHQDFINSVLHIIPGGLANHTRPLMHSDQPEHTWFKDAMLPVFNGPAVTEILPPVRAFADKLVGQMVAAEDADLVRDFCGILMAHTLVQFFGMDHVDPYDLDRWLRQYVSGGQDRDQDTVLNAHASLLSIAEELIEDRRQRPRDPQRDLATALVQARHDGEPLDPDKIVGAVRQPFVIVWLATSHSLGNMLQRLLEDRELQEQLRTRPELISEAIEEFLRMDMPQLGFGRSAARPATVGGQQVAEDDAVALVFPAANRDPEVFECPEEFRIGRSPNPHLTFGAGIHSCPGRKIARGVVRTALEAVITGTGDLELAGPIEKEHWPFRAPRTLPATVSGPEA